jgi:hypothetical protein
MPVGKIWRITRRQISSGDVDGAIVTVDPEQIADREIVRRHGAVRLRIEGFTGPADLCGNLAARKFFRRLHQRWPWAGYFLQLQPVTAGSPVDRIMDVAWFLGRCLCHVRNIAHVRTRDSTRILFQPAQLSCHLVALHTRARQPGNTVDLPAAAIARRDALMVRAITRSFEAGKAHHAQINNHSNKRKKNK